MEKRGIERVSVYFDAAIRDDQAAFAFVVFSDGDVLHKDAGLFDTEPISEDRAQYLACLLALDWLLEHKKRNHHVRLYNDGLTVINQVNKVWPEVRHDADLNDQVLLRAWKFKDIAFTWTTKKELQDVTRMALGQLEPSERA